VTTKTKNNALQYGAHIIPFQKTDSSENLWRGEYVFSTTEVKKKNSFHSLGETIYKEALSNSFLGRSVSDGPYEPMCAQVDFKGGAKVLIDCFCLSFVRGTFGGKG
jgi:hypothetical protein